MRRTRRSADIDEIVLGGWAVVYAVYDGAIVFFEPVPIVSWYLMEFE